MENIKLTRTSIVFVVLAILATALIIGYWMLTFSGPYRWSVNFEIQQSGAYHPEIAFLTTFVCGSALVLLPFGALTSRLGLLKKKMPDGQMSALAKGEFSTLLRELTATGRKSIYRLAFFGAGLSACLMGLFQILSAMSIGSRVDLDLSHLEDGPSTSAMWVTTRGHFLFDHAQAWGELPATAVSRVDHYVPLVSDTWSAGKPVAIVVHVETQGDSQTLQDVLGSDELQEGLVSKMPLPGLIKQGFESGHLNVPSSALIVEWHETPDGQALTGKITLIIGMFVVAIVGFITWLKRKRA